MSYKAQALAHDLADELKKRLPFLTSTITVTEGADSNGDPTISVNDGSAATSEKVVFIRVKAFDGAGTIGTNIIGQAQEVYSPSKLQIALETQATNGSYLSYDDLFQLLGTCLKRGVITELWMETNGTAPSVTTFNTASKLKSTFTPDLYHGMRAAQ